MNPNPEAFSTQDALDAANYVQAARSSADGEKLSKLLKITFDPGTNDDLKAIGAHLSALALSKGVIVKRAFYRVINTFTSATDAATIAISVKSANDIVTATAISAGTNSWDAGLHEGIQVGTMATALLLDANYIVTFTVAVEVLTDGKLELFLEVVPSSDE